MVVCNRISSHEAERECMCSAHTWYHVAGSRYSTNAGVFPCIPWFPAQCLGPEGVGSRKEAGGGTREGKEWSPAGVSEQVGGLTDWAHSQDLA